MPLRYDPGTKWLYSLATDVCGCLVEAISGQKFEDFLQQRIFEPLGMQDTAFWVPPEKVERFAANYERAADKSLRLIDDPLESKYLHAPSFPSGGGGLVSTTADYAKFCEMLRLRGTVNGVGNHWQPYARADDQEPYRRWRGSKSGRDGCVLGNRI